MKLSVKKTESFEERIYALLMKHLPAIDRDVNRDFGTFSEISKPQE
jgi:hypothetical protein